MHVKIKLDLLKLKGAFVTDLKGKTETKRCLVIPIADARLFEGKKGCYLDLQAREMKTSQYGDSHFVSQHLSKEEYQAMSELERHMLPIIGSMRPLQWPPQDDAEAATAAPEALAPTDVEEVPF